MAQQDPEVKKALELFEAAALNFAYRYINMSSVRMEYMEKTKAFSAELLKTYAEGRFTAHEAADTANRMRNEIMNMSRSKSCDLGKAIAGRIKAKGLDLDTLLSKYAEKTYSKPFNRLNPAQQDEVYLEIVRSAGRANPKVSLRARNLGRAGRALWLLAIGVAIYNVGTAHNKTRQAGREAAGMGGGFLAGAGAGAAGGALFGPVGVVAGALIGGVIGSIMADEAYIEIVGPDDDFVRKFLPRFTQFFARDEDKIALALVNECGINMDQVHAVFLTLNDDYNTDADDVAVLYINTIRKRSGNLERALKLNVELRHLLISILSEGYTSSDEQACLNYLRAR